MAEDTCEALAVMFRREPFSDFRSTHLFSKERKANHLHQCKGTDGAIRFSDLIKDEGNHYKGGHGELVSLLEYYEIKVGSNCSNLCLCDVEGYDLHGHAHFSPV